MSQYTLDLKGQRFSGARFGRYLRLYCDTNRSYIFSYFAIMLFGMLACQLVAPLVSRFKAYDNPDRFDIYAITGGMLCCMFGFIMLLEGGRRVYNRMSRPDVKNTLMVPASQFEKSMVWCLIWIAGSWLAGIVSFAAAEAIRVGISHIFAAHPEDIRWIIEADIPRNYMLMMTASLLFSQALFVLAGTVWYRNVWVKMIAFYFALQTLTSVILVSVMVALFKNNFVVPVGQDFEEVFEGTLIYGSLAYSCVGTVVCYLIAYFRNKENGLNFRW